MRMKKYLSIFIIVILLFSIFSIGYSIWVISSKTLIKPSNVTSDVVKKYLDLSCNNAYTYNGSIQLPTSEVLDTSELTFYYKESGALEFTKCTETIGPKNAGTYEIKVEYNKNTGVDTFETITINPTNNFVISPKSLEVLWSNTIINYDGSPHLPTATITSGLISGDSCNVTVSVDGYASGPTDIGTYSAIATTDNSNYIVSNSPKTFVIKSLVQELSVEVADEQTSVYNGTAQGPSGIKVYLSTKDLEGNELSKEEVNDATLTYSYNNLSSTEIDGLPTDASGYNVTINASKSGCTSGSTTVYFTISKRDIDLSWSYTTVTYDGNTHGPTFTYSGVIADDDCTIAVSNLTQTNAGTYEAVASLSGTKAKNYQLNSSNSKFSYIINKKQLTFANTVLELAYSADSRTFDAIKMLISPTLNGVIAGDTVTTAINGMNDGTFGYGTDASITGLNDSSVTGVATTYKNVVGSTYLVNYALEGSSTNNYYITDNLILKYKTVLLDSVYYTIEDALLNSSTSMKLLAGQLGNTTYVLTAFTNLSNKSSLYSSSNTYTVNGKLRVPFDNVDMDYHGSGGETGSTSNGYESTAVTSSNNVFSCLYIPSGITLQTASSSSSSIIVGGLVSGLGYVYNRGIIINNGNIIINSSSNFGSYGFIKGNGLVELNNGSTTIDVFKMYDWGGGSTGYGYYVSNHIFPISAYAVHNLSCKTKIYPGASYKAFWNINFNNAAFKGYKRGNVTLVGSGGLFQLTNGYIYKSGDVGKSSTATTLRNSLNTVIGSNQQQGQRDKIEIYGTCTDSSVSIVVDIPLMDFEMKSSTDVALPISFMDIYLKKDSSGNTASLTLKSSSYNFLPGTVLEVDNGCSLNIENKVQTHFYSIEDAISDESKKSIPFVKASGGMCIDRFDSKLIINGTLNINSGGYLSGNIDSTSSTGNINVVGNIKNPVWYVSDFVNNGGEINLIITKIYYDKVTASQHNYYAKAKQLQGNIFSDYIGISQGTYYSIEKSGSYGWYSTQAQINFDLNGGTSDSAISSIVRDIPINVGYVIQESDLPSVTINKDYYTFNGWYIDAECTTLAVDSVIYSNTTLYAGYTPNTYYLSYNYVYRGGCISSSSITNNNPEEYNITSIFTLQNPTNGLLVFGGWYLDEDCTIAISQIINEHGDKAIYGLWYPEGTETYTINYVITNSSSVDGLEVSKESSSVISINTSWQPDNLGLGINDDTTISYYFDGWYLNSDFTEPFESLTNDCTLYGRWIDKNVINLSYNTTTLNYYYIPNSTITLPAVTNNNETLIWFTNNTYNSAELYIGGRSVNTSDFARSKNLYGTYYYVITSEMYENSNFVTNITNKSNILFDGVNFDNETMNVSISFTYNAWPVGYTSSANKSKSRFADKAFEKIILNNCTLKKPSSGQTYSLANKKVFMAGTFYGLAYNGLFDNCSSLKQVIICGTTVLESQTFSNCSSLSTIINSAGAIADISKFKPTDVLGNITSEPTVVM